MVFIVIDTLDELKECMRKPCVTLVDYTVSWCGPCKRLYPDLVKLSELYPEVLFVKVDVDAVDGAADECKIPRQRPHLHHPSQRPRQKRSEEVV